LELNFSYIREKPFMETLNKNWFTITLISVIFGILGFLIGRQGNKHSCSMENSSHEMIHKDGSIKVGKKHMIFISDGNEMIEDIDIQKEVEVGEDGEKKIKITAKAKKK
jgi:hypothetical protein